MPKKRHTTHFPKPQTTVHPSLAFASTVGTTQNNDTPSVNDLISSLRAQQIAKDSRASSSPVQVAIPTLPPSIRHLLAAPETPPPKPRNVRRRRRDDSGNLLPAGPAPPRSWLEKSQYAPSPARRPITDMRPSEVAFLPGLVFRHSPTEEAFQYQDGSLQSLVLRAIARQWECISEYEKYNLIDLPTRLRMILLSYIAVYGPDGGVGSNNLRHILTRPAAGDEFTEDQTWSEQVADNEDFFRLDLSRSFGRSVGFKDITALVTRPHLDVGIATQVGEAQDSWEQDGSLIHNPRPILPHLTHLSLSHPPLSSSSASWSKLLAFAKHTPTITHVSLAFWPIPTMTPHSSTAYIAHPQGGKDIQFSGTGYYAHSLDGDFTEAASILRRLSTVWYALVYFDLRGCQAWSAALRWNDGGIDWSSRWQNLKKIMLGIGIFLPEESSVADVQVYSDAWAEMSRLDTCMRLWRKKGTVIDLVGDDFRPYEAYWMDESEESMLKRKLLRLNDRPWLWGLKSRRLEPQFVDTGSASNIHGEDTAWRNSMWEQ